MMELTSGLGFILFGSTVDDRILRISDGSVAENISNKE